MNTPPALVVPPFDALSDACEGDLGRARARLITARAAQRVKDSTGNRACIAECRTQIDAILDLYLDARGTPGSATRVTSPAPAVA